MHRCKCKIVCACKTANHHMFRSHPQENVHEFNNGGSLPNKNDPKYQTLPYNTKLFTPPSSSSYNIAKNHQQQQQQQSQSLQAYNQQQQLQFQEQQQRNYDQLQDEHFEKS